MLDLYIIIVYLPVILVNDCHRIPATTANLSLGSGLNYSPPLMEGRSYSYRQSNNYMMLEFP